MKNILEKAILLTTALLFSITGTSCSSDDSTVHEQDIDAQVRKLLDIINNKE